MFDPTKVNFVPTPNQRSRTGVAVKNIVIHATSGTGAGTIAWFKQARSQVSAHYMVDRDGSITQFVKDEDEAWHVCRANPFCIGIEHVDMWMENHSAKPVGGCTSQLQWWTGIQLTKSAELVAYLMHKFSLPVTAVIGHNDYSLVKYGNSHVDPGRNFPWDLYRRLIREAQAKLSVATVASGDIKINKGGRPPKNKPD